MADKKVERNMRGGQAGPMTPGEVFEASHSKHGTPNMADVAGESGKSALLERFREREERYRRDQSLQAHAEAATHLPAEAPASSSTETPAEAETPPEPSTPREDM
jgi:hypothetical protein